MTGTIDRPVYPSEAEADVVLRDGSTVRVRPVRDGDRNALRAFLDGVSPDAIWFRFFTMANLDWAADWAADVDYHDRFGLVVETGSPRQIIAHAAYVRDGDRAEVAFLVSDARQGQGIATILLAHLAARAAAQDITTFVADVLPANHRMIAVFQESGFAVDVRRTRESVRVEFATSLSPEAAARFRERDRIASVAAVARVLSPRSVVVVGASRRRGTVGGELLHNIVKASFTGSLYAVNENGGLIHGIDAYRSVSDLPAPGRPGSGRGAGAAGGGGGPGVRRRRSPRAGRDLRGLRGGRWRRSRAPARAARAVPGIRGPAGRPQLPRRPQHAARRHGSTPPSCPTRPSPGTIAFLSQSGGLGIAIIEAAARLGVGLSSFVSVGNKADLSGNDFLQYWEEDPATSVALLYLESFGNPRKFARVARRFSAHQAGRGGQERPFGSRRAGHRLPHRGAAGRLRCDSGCTVRTGRRDPHRHARRDVRRRRRSCPAARPRRRPGGDRHQRRRSGDRVRRRL